MKLIKWLKEQEKRLLVKTIKPKSIFKIEGVEGEEQKEVKKETFERETQETLSKLIHNQNLIIRKQISNQEKLENLDEKLIEIIKMLMSLKDKL